MIAMNTDTGKRRWDLPGGAGRVVAATAQASPLYFGSWDRKVHAVRRPAPAGAAGPSPRRRGDQHLGGLLEGDDLHRLRRPARSTRSTPGTGPASGGRPSRAKRVLLRHARPWPTGGCSSATRMARCTPTARAAAACCGPSRSAPYIYAAAGVAKKRVFTGTYDGLRLFAQRRYRRRGVAEVRARGPCTARRRS